MPGQARHDVQTGLLDPYALALGARVVVLTNDPFWSRHAIIHELYHLLGFVHPDESEGVMMSEELMHGAQNTNDGIAFPTQSTATDLAKLACIYD